LLPATQPGRIPPANQSLTITHSPLHIIGQERNRLFLTNNVSSLPVSDFGGMIGA
jgi:hypothetical protein